ncbi:MAG: hypothetical protein H6831_08600 [Planctomycetes bacterium]|nr:hypothetical protein [Planctomycetota bacterium]MCB9904453.1 hypothetical protein [Planctomycetota bacterium]
MNRTLHSSLTAALLSLCATGAYAWVDLAPRADDAVQETKRKEIKRLEAWPEPRDSNQLKVDVARLRKANTEEMGSQAHIALVAEGAAAAPALISALGKEKNKDARERITDVLEQITGAEHTRLIAAEFGDKSDVVRIWCLRRVAAFPDSGVREAAVAALQRVEKSKKPDAEELYVAALCATSAGDLSGLQRLAERAEDDWKDSGAEIRTALESVRGKEATAAFVPLLSSEKRNMKVTGLNLLAGAGEAETSVALIKPFLDDTDNTLRVAAINALRGIVDGEPPLDKLPVFEAIELANEWKKRV